MLNEKLKIVSRFNNSDDTMSTEFSRVRRKINENSSGVLNSSECGLLVGNATKTILNENEKKEEEFSCRKQRRVVLTPYSLKLDSNSNMCFFCAIDLIQFE